jgi:DNA-directed RNA polymerase specialized sigma24 family protein
MVLGAGFERVLRAAQAGDEAAFVRLWRDANPVMTRYLRVAGLDDPYDAACEGWITVVRGLPGFRGDETDWRLWVLACARMRAEESSLRRSWGSVTALPGVWSESGEEPLELDDLETTGDVAHRGVNDAIAAIRALPLGQGEVVMLRLCAQLPVSAVAHIVGSDADGVRRTETRGLERLDIDPELLGWSLTAPATPAELADERVVTGAFRSLPRSVPRAGDPGGARVVALGPRQGRPRGARPAGWSRSALVGLAAMSATAVSLGGLGAAAYTGSLPAPVQRVMHDALGAPAPRGDVDQADQGAASGGSSGKAGPSSTPGPAVGPGAGSAAASGLCRAWAQDQAKGVARDRSVAYRNLAAAAGGAGQVTQYCAATAVGKTPHPGKTTDGSAKGSPTHSTGPADVPSRTGSKGPKTPSTATRPTRSSNTNAPNSRSTQSGSPTSQHSGSDRLRSTTPTGRTSVADTATDTTVDTSTDAAADRPGGKASSVPSATGKGQGR